MFRSHFRVSLEFTLIFSRVKLCSGPVTRKICIENGLLFFGDTKYVQLYVIQTNE